MNGIHLKMNDIQYSELQVAARADAREKKMSAVQVSVPAARRQQVRSLSSLGDLSTDRSMRPASGGFGFSGYPDVSGF
jgi:hypothetical protein